MKDKITDLIRDYVRNYEAEENIKTKWGVPLVGFADAAHPYILNIRQAVSPDHGLPQDIIPDAKIVIAYFIPFTKEVSESNSEKSWLASREWAVAYEETNAMFVRLNEYLVTEIRKMGYKAAFPENAVTFDNKKLISNWSHRHFAFAAGLGTFGLNNLMITESGCCGRYSSIVTDLDAEPDSPQTEEFCLYKRNGSCGVCVKRCPSGALTTDGYDRHKCYEICLKNAEVYNDLGCSYTDENGRPVSAGSDVCGKCAVCLPCSFKSP